LIERDFDDTSLISNSVNHLLEDQSGLLWVATSNGVSKHSYLQTSSALIQKQADNQGLSGNQLHRTALIDNEQMLIATSGGLNKLRFSDGRVEQIELFSEAKKVHQTNDVWGISRDPQGRFWLTSANGIHQYDPIGCYDPKFRFLTLHKFYGQSPASLAPTK